MREPLFIEEPPVLVVCELFIPQIMLAAANYVHEAKMAEHLQALQYSGSRRRAGKRRVAASFAGGRAHRTDIPMRQGKRIVLRRERVAGQRWT